MTIKSDIWIEKMARDHNMISPFESKQVREQEYPLGKAPLVFSETTMKITNRDGTPARRPDGSVMEVPATGINVERTRKVVSFGCSSFGYDMRVADEWKVFTNTFCTIVDPKNLDERSFVDIKADHILIPPNSFALARSVERFVIPEDVLCIVLGKSTYARVGIVVNVTPLEPGWEGHVTIEVSNTTPLPAKIYSNEGIAQVLFFQSDQRCRTSYRDKAGKYQDQPAKVVLPKV